jgi:hypothetical protein
VEKLRRLRSLSQPAEQLAKKFAKPTPRRTGLFLRGLALSGLTCGSFSTEPFQICNFQIAPFSIFAQNLYAIINATIANVNPWSGDQFFHLVLALAAE